MTHQPGRSPAFARWVEPSPRLFLGLLVGVLLAGPAWAGTTNSWRVFRTLSGATLGANRIANPAMETLSGSPPLANWGAFSSGYTVSTVAPHGGVRAMQCAATLVTEIHGGSQTITLNQSTAKAIKLSGWSKASGVTGAVDSDYSLYLDIVYADNTPLWGQTVNFSVGTHDWEYKELFVMPAQPIKSISCYLLFRNSHSGTVWFDDVSIAEVQESVTQFDGAPVVAVPPTPLPFDTANRVTLQSGDGLELQLTRDGGAIETVKDGTNSLQVAAGDYASGWFICDRGAGSDWWSVGGGITNSADGWQQHGVMTNLNLAAELKYVVTNNAIRIQATVSNLAGSDRAISLYFALPVGMDSGYWWNSPRDQMAVTQNVESATLSSLELGARNLVSQYPLATLAANAALNLAVPPDQYRPFRLTYNRSTHQFFAAFDLGLSAIPTNFPQIATAELWLYRSDPAWGLRDGLAGYYRRFPAAFTRAYTNEGIWAAFADLHSITNVSDFGIGYHEIGYNAAFVKSDDTNDIRSYRYVSEPWSYWMLMPTNIPNTDYNSVYSYLQSQQAQGVKAATATLSSGLRDPTGALEFQPAAAPWCPYGAVFTLNPSPGIVDPLYPVTKFNNEWNSTVRDVYNHPENGILDGEYIDSFCAAALSADYQSNHLRSTTFPLTYTRDNFALMTPLIFGTCEMARAIGSDIHALGKPLIANTVFPAWPMLPVGIGLFDFAGTEVNWFDAGGNFVAPADGILLYARALSGARPYGYLLNTDFSKVSSAEMESYMRLCAVYGIYPSAFSADAASNNYFEQPALYERDRPLFKKYVPIIRALSRSGWRPVTAATVDNAALGLEAFGFQPVLGQRYLTVRNFKAQSATGTVVFDLDQWAFPNAQWLRLTNLCDGGVSSVNLAAGSNSIALSLAAAQCVAYAVQAGPPPAPDIVTNSGSLGVTSNQFAFQIAAQPGQTVVVEAGTNLVDWLPLQTNLVAESRRISFLDPEPAARPWRFYRARLQ